MPCSGCVAFASVFSLAVLIVGIVLWTNRDRICWGGTSVPVSTPAVAGALIFLLGAAAGAWLFIGAVPYFADHPGRGILVLAGMMIIGWSIAAVAAVRDWRGSHAADRHRDDSKSAGG